MLQALYTCNSGLWFNKEPTHSTEA